MVLMETKSTFEMYGTSHPQRDPYVRADRERLGSRPDREHSAVSVLSSLVLAFNTTYGPL